MIIEQFEDIIALKKAKELSLFEKNSEIFSEQIKTL